MLQFLGHTLGGGHLSDDEPIAVPLLLNHLILTGKLHNYLADLDEQAQDRCRLIIRQMAASEGVTEELKHQSQWEWVRAMNSIVDRAEESIKRELIYT